MSIQGAKLPLSPCSEPLEMSVINSKIERPSDYNNLYPDFNETC